MPKVLFTEDYTAAVDGINIVHFKKDEEYDLPEETAALYIGRKKCVEAKSKPAGKKPAGKSNKADKPKENK